MSVFLQYVTASVLLEQGYTLRPGHENEREQKCVILQDEFLNVAVALLL